MTPDIRRTSAARGAARVRVPRLPARSLIATIAIVACAGFLTIAAAGTSSVPTKRTPSLRDSPGWYPIVDPESMSVLIGRRTNAPLVSKPFKGGARSLDELGRTICRLLGRSDRDSLMTLCIRDDEFRDILWREFPHSRPITGLTWEDGWISLTQRLSSGCSGAISEHGGRPYEFLRFEVDSVANFKNFKLHMGLRMVVRDDQGQTIRMRWLRAVAERKQRFKIYSTND
jgi:hypothetical protein